MSADLARVGLAVTEAQAVLELVVEKLSTDEPVSVDVAFRLFAAVSAAIERLDTVHDALQEECAPSVTVVAVAPEVLQ